jgi:hypothetical protein
MAGGAGGGDPSATSAQFEGMSETVSSSESRPTEATSSSFGASSRGSELEGAQAVESCAEPEGIVSSRNRCSELAAQIQLPYGVSVRNGAGIEHSEMFDCLF